MGKRYYCDYCDRSFLDGADNRKKHITGVQHQKMQKLHYDSYRSASEILEEEAVKNPCKRFKQQGSCDFGSSCRYSHLTPAELKSLQDQAWKEKIHIDAKLTAIPKVEDSWLTAWTNKVQAPQSSESISNQLPLEFEIESWTLPTHLSTFYSIPPSLIPSTLQDFQHAHLANWG